MKRIFIITQFFQPEANGRASRLHGLVKFLQKYHDVTVIAPPPTWPFGSYKKADYFYKKEEIDGIKVVRLWTSQPSQEVSTFLQRLGYYMSFSFFCSLFLLTRPFSFDTVIASIPASSVLYSTLIARLFRKKIVLDIGDLEIDASVFEGKKKVKHAFLKKMARKFVKNTWQKSDIIFTNNKGIHKQLKLEVENPDKVKFLPFLVDLNKFKKLEVPKENQLVFVGILAVNIYLQGIIKAMPKVLQNFPDLKLQIYGGGEQGPKLKSLVKELKIENNCFINEPVPREQIPTILSKSLMGIVGLVDTKAMSHTTPNKTFEYLACSLPVFGYGPSKALDKILKEAKAGIHVYGNDPEKIADALIKILNDRKSLDEFSINGRKYLEKNVDYTKIAELM